MPLSKPLSKNRLYIGKGATSRQAERLYTGHAQAGRGAIPRLCTDYAQTEERSHKQTDREAIHRLYIDNGAIKRQAKRPHRGHTQILHWLYIYVRRGRPGVVTAGI
jgi:hypothetical protein